MTENLDNLSKIFHFYPIPFKSLSLYLILKMIVQYAKQVN